MAFLTNFFYHKRQNGQKLIDKATFEATIIIASTKT